jgi:hypothetical protein
VTRSVPLSDEGYAIDTASRRVHLRYALHASGLVRARSISAVYNRLGNADPIPCDDCFPPPVPELKPRRVRKAEVVVEVEPEPGEPIVVPDFGQQYATKGGAVSPEIETQIMADVMGDNDEEERPE